MIYDLVTTGNFIDKEIISVNQHDSDHDYEEGK